MNGQFDIGGITPTRYFFSIAVVLGILFAMVSTDQDKSTAQMLLQWQMQTIIPMALLIATHMALLRASVFNNLCPWLALSLSGLIGATLFTPVALAIDLWIETDTGPTILILDELFQEWIGVTPPVAISWVALNAPWVLGYRLEKTGTPSIDVSPEQDPIIVNHGFMKLIDPLKQGRLLYLKSELHYLQVVTSKGSSLILYNLSDAIEQLPETLGIPVHRSFWVALNAISEFKKRGRQGELILVDGTSIPVSRNRLKQVKSVIVSKRLGTEEAGNE